MNRLLLLTAILFCFFSSRGQVKATEEFTPPPSKPIPKPENVRVISQDTERGNLVRTIQYELNRERITEIIIKPLPKNGFLSLNRAIKPDTLIKDSIEIKVSKLKYKVDVFYKRQLIRSYAAVFGPKPHENKCREGDRCTPEGTFRIIRKNPASQYNKCMMLDYPTDSSKIRFASLKASGSIPSSAAIGGNIGIHGVWKGGDDLIELGVGWTDGCIALKNKDIDELYSFVGVGTRVTIKR